ncbi:hypothetical protein WJX79_011010 [Trebouxia sp. C0005]
MSSLVSLWNDWFLSVICLAVAALVPVVYLLLKSTTKRPTFLEPNLFKELPLIDKKVLSYNTRLFRFGLPTKDTLLGLPIGQHITFKAKDGDGKDFFRPYTPTTDDDTPGHVDFVIKVYPEGKMSQHLDKMEVGQTMLFKGPKGRYQYQQGSLRAIGMLAGGTGVTPMYQVANAILKNPDDKTQITLLFANVSADDILIEEELTNLQALSPQFKVHYVLNKPPPGWTGAEGFISSELIKKHFPPPGEGVKILRCGPLPMNKAMKAHLDALGYTPEMQFEF